MNANAFFFPLENDYPSYFVNLYLDDDEIWGEVSYDET